MLKLSFHGGVGTVTGSRHLLSTDTGRVLVNAGLFQGLKELRLLNWRRPSFDPATVDHLLLTHTHIDHAGYLPRLVRDGYSGPIHCTEGTHELAGLLLEDSAKLQEEDAEYANRKGYSRHHPALPLYTVEDVRVAMRQFRSTEYGKWIELGRGLRARFLNAGHILGAAVVELRVTRGEEETIFVFSGDLGRYNVPLHRDPVPLPACDYLIVESTYGDRKHDPTPMVDQISAAFHDTIANGGVVLVPAFAVGRAQLITLLLREAMWQGKLPDVPIHIDSPMAIDATAIYSRHLKDGTLDPHLGDGDRLFPRRVQFHRTVAESKHLNSMGGPRIVIASSGMLTGGRVVHHLHRLLPDPKNLLLLVGYQAAGTRGRALLDGARTLRMHGQVVAVKAPFVQINGLSAHADADELVRWISAAPRPPRRVFVTHGEANAAQALAKRLRDELHLTVDVPKLDDAYDLEA